MSLTVDEIHLLRKIAVWRRSSKWSFFQWRTGRGFGAITEWKLYNGKRQMHVSYERPNEHRDASIAVTRDYYGSDAFRELPASNVAQAVDMLVVLGYLPVRFSSAYAEGWDARAEATDTDGHLALLTWPELKPMSKWGGAR